MKNTIYKYFFHEFVRYFIVVLFALTAVIWTIQAVNFLDIPIMSAYLVFIAFVFVMINFIVDILYYFIDPRIRVKGDATSG